MHARGRCRLGVALIATVASTACVSTAAVSRPVPFPGAVVVVPAAAVSRAAMRVADVLQTALGLIGTPYRVGGEAPPTGFDCSGFVRYVFSREQIALPRTVTGQFGFGEHVKVGSVRAGDLLFFSTEPGPSPSHVGIALDRETFVHAPGAGRFVRVEHFDTTYWRKRLAGVRRVAGAT